MNIKFKYFFIIISFILELTVLFIQNFIFNFMPNLIGWLIFEIIQALFIVLLIGYGIYMKKHFNEITRNDIIQLSLTFLILGLIDYLIISHIWQYRCWIFVLGALIINMMIFVLKLKNTTYGCLK